MQNEVLARAVDRPLAGKRRAAAHDVRRLIDAGLVVIRRHGGLDPKVSEIVREAGLSNQAFYRHFASKDELLLAILAEGRRELLAFLERRMAAERRPVDQAKRWIEGVLAQAGNAKAASATRPFAVNAARLARDFPDEVAASADALKAPLRIALAATGARDPDRDADAIYLLAFGAMERHLVAGTRPTDAEADHLIAFAIRGALRGAAG